MKHVIIGGDGLVGRHLAAELTSIGEMVLVADINKSEHPLYDDVPFVHVDIRDHSACEGVSLDADDVVYSLAAKMLNPPVPRTKRRETLWSTNYTGVENILTLMERRRASKLVHFSTDMVYGYPQSVPINEDHPTLPLGEYGKSKLASEELCQKYRERGMNISIFRPRLIIGPGRLGILAKLFNLVDKNLPIPMIGSGRNAYQFVSVFDCVSATRRAWQAGCPNQTYNLGSYAPPSVRQLLASLISEAQSRSIILSTPASIVKAVLKGLDYLNMPVMDPEQYLIADEHYILDTSKAECWLGWRPERRDEEMLIAAYREYRRHPLGLADHESAPHTLPR